MSQPPTSVNRLKALASDTALYGMSSIVGRLLNYLLVPLHTAVFLKGEYGIVSELYAYAGFVMVFFVYRMETAFFRFGTNKVDREMAFSTGMVSLLATTFCFVTLGLLLTQPIADFLLYPNHPEYIRYFVLILGFDALLELPYARLRLDSRPYMFVFGKIFNIAITIFLNLFWLWFCPKMAAKGVTWVHTVWSPDVGVGYVFLANLIAAGLTFLVLLPRFRFSYKAFDLGLWIKMLRYSGPLILVSFAGIINEMLDRAILKRLLPGSLEENLAELGVYSANYKLAMLITLFTQAYRYAAEPFFFKNDAENKENSLQVQADSTKWFTIFASAGLLGTLAFLPVLKGFINEKFHDGLAIVPILLLANVFLGVYYNFSIWYRLRDKTHIGAWIAVFGALITLVLNLWWVPRIGYLGSAWATAICYAFMCIAAWWTGRVHYPAPYPLGRMFLYIVLALALYALLVYSPFAANALQWLLRFGVCGVFALVVWVLEIKKGNKDRINVV